MYESIRRNAQLYLNTSSENEIRETTAVEDKLINGSGIVLPVDDEAMVLKI